ncbi:GIN1 [Branchiostoma lanceolatum]|uniref:Gypsy retrotransposon integrase-like protein 1 n=1 Tax=Branchiostoma lanceolatum TaxID=7740 RepID=A0A8J9YV44_BRALA|nr:GIN1 [Branchiostoma lanceolatum]
MDKYIEAGEKLGLAGEDLLKFVQQQQAVEREDRAKERELEKLKVEAEEREKERQRETEKLKLEAEEKEKERQREAEKLKLEAEEKEFERQREVEKRRFEAEEKEKERQEREAERRHQREMIQLGLVREDRTETEHVRAKAPKLPPFVDGKDEVDAYLQRFERFATANAWEPDTWASSLCALLTGRALEVFSRLDNTEAQDYKCVKEALMKRYNLTEEGFRTKFRQSKPEAGESPGQFLVRISSYLERWMELSDTTKSYEDLRDMFVREQFMETCSRDLAVHLKERAPKDLKEMAQMAENFLSAHKRELSTRADSAARENPQYLPTSRRCFTCDSPDHLVKDCPRNRSGARTSPKSFYVDRRTPSSAFEVKGRVEGRQVPLLLDTGSTQTLIHADLVDPGKVKPSRQGKITCVHGDEKGYPDAEVEIGIGPEVYRVTAKVAPNLPRLAIIGRDIPNLAGMVQACASGKVESFVTTRAQARLYAWEDRQLEAETARSGVRLRQLSGSLDASQDDPIGDWRLFSDDLFYSNGKARKSKKQRRTDKRRGPPDTRPRDNSLRRDADSVDRPDVRELTPQDIRRLQLADTSLEKVRQMVERGDDPQVKVPAYVERDGMIYRVWRQEDEDQEGVWQLVLPQQCRALVLQLAHNTLMAGHLGKKKTTDRILQHFFWPGLHKDVKTHCQSCEECQKAAKVLTKNRAPLIPLPIIEEPFRRIAMDVVGPLERSKTGNKYVLVVCDYATRYPEAIPMRSVDAKRVAEELTKMFARVGIPEEILTDQGTNFMSQLLKEMYSWLKIRGIRTSPYHPQTDGLVERFNGTLKSMLKKVSKEDPKDWDKLVPYLLFAYREVPQESTGFSPFELLYGRNVRGPLQVLRESWEESPKSSENVISYIMKMRERLSSMTEMVGERLKASQAKQKLWYDKRSRAREFSPGDQVLVLLPSSKVKLEAEWQGPYTVVRRVGSVDYELETPEKRKKHVILHVNLLKKWYQPSRPCLATFKDEAGAIELEDGQEVSHLLGKTEDNPSAWQEVIIDEGLDPEQRRQLEELLREFSDVMQDRPGLTNLAQHHIDTGDAKPIRQRAYRVPQAHRDEVREELRKMEEMGVIEPSSSEWASPVVLVPKKDGSIRFCVDFRRINAVSRFDAYPIPRIDEMLDKLGKAKYITKIDLARGYWQVPLTEESKEKTAFVTSFGLYQFHTMPFGLHGAAATFQRLMDNVLRGTEEFADDYIDDLDVFSNDWDDHLMHLREILTRLRNARLTAKPSKCHFAMRVVPLLGHVVGGGQVRPDEEKVRAVREFPRPETKKDVRAFLGLTGYYRRFIPQYAQIAAPLSDLTGKRKPQMVQWMGECEESFKTLKGKLCQQPVLQSPDFERPFILQTDASERGIGAVLSQKTGEGEEHPIVYVSRKLLPREQNYSVPEKECLAIKYAVESLRYYLLGREFEIMTDHHPLKWLDQMKDKNQRLSRWSLSLQPYRFVVTHRAGTANANADALSRA